MADKSNEKTTKPLDEQFREMVTQWERNFDAFANQMMGTESFTRSMNQAQDAQMTMRKLFQDYMARNLETANMPTREDIVHLAEAVQAVDRRLSRIEDALMGMQSNSSPGSARQGPPRTKQPPSRQGDQ
ncbi:MAG: hypothetical protein H6993_14855 [Pseudomonadales bacterium]|nr:hypothetical protein [Pseudomonadales bacterium]MCP5185242.1 hypothetical protein [Pseudomonadales bacterium]